MAYFYKLSEMLLPEGKAGRLLLKRAWDPLQIRVFYLNDEHITSKGKMNFLCIYPPK